MISSYYTAPSLECSIPETEFKVDVVTVCLTASCSLCKGEYVNHVLGHKFVCRCSCHKDTTIHIDKDRFEVVQANIASIVREVNTT